MYSEAVTQRAIEEIEAARKIKFQRLPIDESLNISEHLHKLRDEDKLYGPKGEYATAEIREFVINETFLCQQDFLYFLRYVTIERDGAFGGGIGSLARTLWESQEILIKLVAKLEDKNDDHRRKGYPCEGILIGDNKGGRQLGHTLICRAIINHRLVLWPHTRAMSGSVDESAVLKLYNVDKLIIDNLPFWLRPSGWDSSSFDGFDKKGEHIRFGPKHGSSVLYQHSRQESGIGTGSQFDVNHNTELSSWENPERLSLDFFPTLPQSHMTFSLQETTPIGRNNWWHKWSENVRHGKMPRWAYLYIPFYSEPKKYRLHAPEAWKPQEITLNMAFQVFETSQEFVGKQVILHRDQMFWWETMYNEALTNNELNKFLSNYSITPEQSFQHSTIAAIRSDVLDWMRSTRNNGIFYEVDGL